MERRNEMKSQEIWIFITVAVMQIGFTVTLGKLSNLQIFTI